MDLETGFLLVRNIKFKIKPRKITECTVELPDGDTCGYTGEPVRPITVVKYKGTIIPYDPTKTYDINDSNPIMSNWEMGIFISKEKVI